MSFYRLTSILNNNAVVARNERGEEVIVTGKAVGFAHKTGDVLRDDEVSRVYVSRNDAAGKRLQALFQEIPYPCIEVAEKIVDVASAALSRSFSQNLIISLSDHINFCIQQHKADAYQKNLLSEEIERLYPTEYIVGRQGLALIKQDLGVELDPSEAGSIAFHIVNNSGPAGSSLDVQKIINGVEGMLAIIRTELGVELPEDSSHYARLVTHLKFLMRRVIAGERSTDDAGRLFLNIDEGQVAGISRCLDAVAGYLRDTFSYEISNAERLYLFVHVVAITQMG